jgi:hypothetical protein
VAQLPRPVASLLFDLRVFSGSPDVAPYCRGFRSYVLKRWMYRFAYLQPPGDSVVTVTRSNEIIDFWIFPEA